MTIEMIPFNPEAVIPQDGKYLVRSVSTGPLQTVQHLQARCSVVWNEKKKIHMTSVDVNNQTVTHISKLPLE